MSIDQIHIPYRGSPDQPFDLAAIHDNLAEEFADDPPQRQVQFEVAFSLLVGSRPDTVGDAISMLERAAPEARRVILDRARAACGLESVEYERVAATAKEMASAPRHTPERDAEGRIDALCSVEGCGRFEPGNPQFARVAVKSWYCSEHRDSPEGRLGMAPYEGPRYAYGPSGTLVDLDEQERDRVRYAEEERIAAARRERHRAAVEDELDALRPFEEERIAAERRNNRLQNPWAAA